MPTVPSYFQYFGTPGHPGDQRDAASQLMACKKIARDGGSITSELFRHADGTLTTLFTYKDKDGMTCGRMKFDGDPFGLENPPLAAATAPAQITGFSFWHDGHKIFGVGN